MDISAIASAGLDVAQSRFEKAATGVADPPAAASPPDTVSLSDRAVALLSSKNEFHTDVRLAKVADDIKKTTLNILG
jgi:hypothetical protein